MKDFLFLRNGDTKDWFHEYANDLGLEVFGTTRGRWPTMKMALNIFLQRGGGLILETGCQREPEDWGAGASTTLFEKVLRRYDCGTLISVDNNFEHLRRAQGFVKNSEKVSFILSDSVTFLKQMEDPIDLLYLDSYDYPICEILEPYGGPDNLEEGLAILDQMTEAEIISKHGPLLKASQQHCLNEFLAAEHVLHKGSIVLIDDNTLPGGGKARLARQRLLDTGWMLLFDYNQTLWIKS